MDLLTPESIRKEFVLKLMSLVTAFETQAKEIGEEIGDGTNKLGFVPLEVQMGRNAFNQLEKVIEDLQGRRKDMKRGTYRYRAQATAEGKASIKGKRTSRK